MLQRPIDPNEIVSILKKTKIITLEELKKLLETDAERTIFRKLKLLSYLTSYSHKGRYFTLKEIAKFNKEGLWSYESVWFSRFGTLLKTLEVWITESKNGFYAKELEDALHVSVKETLLRLVKSSRISREKISGLYLYCSTNISERKHQLLIRQAEEAADEPTDEVKAALLILWSVLDEKSRRLFAGFESLRAGYGGDAQIAELLGLDPHTVAKGRRELLERDVELERVRREGGGRQKKKAQSSSQKSKS
jgi:hypothetical protein